MYFTLQMKGNLAFAMYTLHCKREVTVQKRGINELKQQNSKTRDGNFNIGAQIC